MSVVRSAAPDETMGSMADPAQHLARSLRWIQEIDGPHRWAVEHRWLLEATAHRFLANGDWPRVRTLQRDIATSDPDRAVTIGQPVIDIPAALGARTDDVLRLTVRALSYVAEAGDLLNTFVSAMRLAVDCYRGSDEDPPQLHGRVLRADLATDDVSYRGLSTLVMDEGWFFEGGSGAPNDDWSRAIRVEVLRLRDVTTVDGYLDAVARYRFGPQEIAATAAPQAPARQTSQPSGPNPRSVMVVHGRNQAARDAMFTFLRTLGLSPTDWAQAVGMTGVGAPHNLAAFRAAVSHAQAVVVLLTAEDEGALIPALRAPAEGGGFLGQPRQNVMVEAGLALGVCEARTILVELGPIRRASDLEGLSLVRLSNVPKPRSDFEACLVGPSSPRPRMTAAMASMTAVSREPGHLEVFWTQPSGGILYRWRDGSQWSDQHEWKQPRATSVAAISRAPGDEVLFGRHPNGAIWYAEWVDDGEGSMHAGTPKWLDGPPIEGPIAVSTVYSGGVALVCIADDGRIAQRRLRDGDWSSWHLDS
jgi:predicted nucleotide-binding protein